ncbi:MAG: hypothetical protein HYY15_05015 [Candidatus Omnitrophica bacterium]|nr:hypothetical protein [Candidatus Omnitrophota bacterium]
MIKRRPLLAIDLGATKIACVVAQRYGPVHGGDILGVGVAAFPLGLPAWPGEPSRIGPVLEQALQDSRITLLPERASVVLNHPDLGHQEVTAHIQLADEPVLVKRRDVERLQAQAVSHALSLDRDVLWLQPLGYAGNGFDGVLDPCGLAATRLHGRFHLVTVPVSVRQAVVQACESVGLEVERLLYGLQASAVACLERGARSADGPQMLIDLGGRSTELGLFEGSRLTAAVTIPWGFQALVQEIAAACRLTHEQALAMCLEGLAAFKPEVRELAERHLQPVRDGMSQLLSGRPLPDAAIVTGRGALVDGVVEWVEAATQVRAALGRSSRAGRLGDLARQVALTPAIGAMEWLWAAHAGQAASAVSPELSSSAGFVDRVLGRAKSLLTEYF